MNPAYFATRHKFVDTPSGRIAHVEQRTRDLARFLAAFDCAQTVAVEEKPRTLQAPALIVWGTDDIYFDVKWSHRLAQAIPGTRRRVEFRGARLFFPEERWKAFNEELVAHWRTA